MISLPFVLTATVLTLIWFHLSPEHAGFPIWILETVVLAEFAVFLDRLPVAATLAAYFILTLIGAIVSMHIEAACARRRRAKRARSASSAGPPL